MEGWLDQYKSAESIGVGGKGSVELNTHRVTGSNIALKRIEVLPENKAHIYRKEDLITKNLSPGIVKLIGEPFSQNADGREYLCLPLEYCAEGSLNSPPHPLREDIIYSGLHTK